MVYSLFVGLVLGALTVVFALQNAAVVTVGFLTWQLTIPLALALLSALSLGVIVTLLVLLPTLIRDELALKAARREHEIRVHAAAQTAQPAL